MPGDAAPAALWPVLEGVRGRPALDVAAAVDALVRLSWLAADLGEGWWRLDLNPILLRAAGEGLHRRRCAGDAADDRRASLLAALAARPSRRAQGRMAERPITLIVPYPPGGSTDNVSRPIQQPLSALLGQNVLIENRGGAGGSIGAAAVAQAKPDGYTCWSSRPPS